MAKVDLVAQVRGSFEAFQNKDLPHILAHTTPQTVWSHGTAGDTAPPWFGTHVGTDAIQSYFMTLVAEVELHRFEPILILNQGNVVMTLLHMEVTVRKSGIRYGGEAVQVTTYDDDGKVVNFRVIYDTAPDLAAWNGVLAAR